MSTRNMSWSVVAAVAATVGLGVPTAGWAQCVPEWSALGSGVGGDPDARVFALTGLGDDGAGPHPPALYAGGDFSTAGNVIANHIARWRCGFRKGDLNCDGALDPLDIDAFVLALTNPGAYLAQYPNCDPHLADTNCDWVVNALDIDPFVNCLASGGCDCP